MNIKTALLLSVCLLSFAAVGCAGEKKAEQPPQAPAQQMQTTPTQGQKNHLAVFETNKGNFTVELFEDKAPITAKNFITLANKGFYNNLIFHRVIDKFMIQSGDPKGNGTGGPGYAIPDEFGPGLKHSSEGVLSMANAGPNTGGSQFFITLAPTPWLDGKHAIFGKVVNGMDVVHAIGKAKTGTNDRPVDPIVITKITITEAK